jgi:hypothetical protein
MPIKALPFKIYLSSQRRKKKKICVEKCSKFDEIIVYNDSTQKCGSKLIKCGLNNRTIRKTKSTENKIKEKRLRERKETKKKKNDEDDVEKSI